MDLNQRKTVKLVAVLGTVLQKKIGDEIIVSPSNYRILRNIIQKYTDGPQDISLVEIGHGLKLTKGGNYMPKDKIVVMQGGYHITDIIDLNEGADINGE